MGFHCEMRSSTYAETPSPLRISAIITVEEVQQVGLPVEDPFLGALHLFGSGGDMLMVR